MDARKACLRIRSLGEFPRSCKPFLRGALWLAGAFAAAFLIYPDGLLYPDRPSDLLPLAGSFSSQGKPLLYGLPLQTTMMPLMGVMSLAAGNADWAGAQFLWCALAFLLCLSGYGLGCLLAGRAAGTAAAAALFAGQNYPGVFFDVEQRLYCLFLLVTANALALACRSRRLGRVLEACAVGLSFLARSALCWFPAVLAAVELLRPGAGGVRRGLAPAALALAVPFLFLLPWLRFNSAAGQKPALFDGRGDWNMVTGAMGLVSTFEGDYRKLAGLERGESALLWSAKRIISHPGAYTEGVIKRTGFIFSKHPLLFASWLVLAALLWRRPAFARVNLLILYFLALHLAFSTEERYFAPLLPLMAAVSAAALFALGERGGEARTEGMAVSAAGAAPVVLAGALCMLLLLRYRVPAAGYGKEDYMKALARSPGDAWLLQEYGRSRLLRGDYKGAYDSLGKAAVLLPDHAAVKIDLAAAALLRNRRHGRPSAGADLIEKLPADLYVASPGIDHILRAFYELDAGFPGKAAESARLARLARRKYIHFKLRSDEAGRLDRAREEDTSLQESALPALLDYFPAELREKLGPAFLKLYYSGKKAGAAPPPATVAAPASGDGAPRAGGLSKTLSDEAVNRMLKNDLARARPLLVEAVSADRDNFEARMNLCFLAAKTGDVELGEEHCGEAVFLSLKPPKHSLVRPDGLSAAYCSRGFFYLRAGDKGRACRDLEMALESAPPGWPAPGELKAACAKQ